MFSGVPLEAHNELASALSRFNNRRDASDVPIALVKLTTSPPTSPVYLDSGNRLIFASAAQMHETLTSTSFEQALLRSSVPIGDLSLNIVLCGTS